MFSNVHVLVCIKRWVCAWMSTSVPSVFMTVFLHISCKIQYSLILHLPAAGPTCGVMYWMLGTDDVYVYFGDTNPVISYCCFSESFATKLPVLRSIGFALIRAYKSVTQQQMLNKFRHATVLWPVTDHAMGCYKFEQFSQPERQAWLYNSGPRQPYSK